MTIHLYDLVGHLRRQRDWSKKTFGPGERTAGVVDHIRKELIEIEASPADLSEWIDVVILAFDGAWRSGHTPEQIVDALIAKQAKNERRTWPDWRTAEPGKAIEHVEAPESATAPTPPDQFPPCPVCGNDETPCDVYEHFTENFEGEVYECNECHSIIPTAALTEWDATRRQPADARLARASQLLRESAIPFDEACDIVRKLLIP